MEKSFSESVKEILKLKPGMYTGINEDGVGVVIFRGKGTGFIVRSPSNDRVCICQEYDEEGHPVGSWPEY